MPLLSPSEDEVDQRLRDVTSTQATRPSFFDRWCRTQVLARLARIDAACVSLFDFDGQEQLGNDLREDGLEAELYVRHPRFYRRVVSGGSMGAAEAYMDGDWLADDLPALLQAFARDWKVSGDIDRNWRRVRRPFQRVWAWLRRNTLVGSRRNIAAHYDLSNEFYRLWLDETMAYSSAVFPTPRATLAEASRHKFDLVCQKLDLQPGDHLLEIGTGWGGFAVHAAENYGCRITTTTISQQQYEYARGRFAERQLTDHITLLDCDYRTLAGRYDKLVSIEMIEAVGHSYLPTYFAKCNDLLNAGGRFVLQAITIPDQRYDRYRRSVDFIQRYIFPGGALPSLGAIERAVGERTSLLLTGMQDYGRDYALTLAAWRERFFDRLHDVRRLGFDERFIRMWDYYLSYCMAGFRERQIGLAQLVFEKQG